MYSLHYGAFGSSIFFLKIILFILLFDGLLIVHSAREKGLKISKNTIPTKLDLTLHLKIRLLHL